MTSIKNAKNATELMKALTKALESKNPSHERIHHGLVRLGDMLESGLDCAAPGQKIPNKEYYALTNAWHESRPLLREMNEHWDVLNAHLVISLFNAYLNGYVNETASATPDLEFLDLCLDEMIAFTCSCGNEEERPFTIIPSRDQVIAFANTNIIDGLEYPGDVERLLKRFADSLGKQCCHPYAIAD